MSSVPRIPDKPFKTYEQQLDRLKNHYHLNIGDEDQAVAALKSFTYYDLINGYKECFMQEVVQPDGTKQFQYTSDITLDFLYNFCYIDKTIQATLFKFSTIIETSFKTKMAYVISEQFGVFQDEYLDNSHYFKSNNGIHYSDIKKTFVEAYTDLRFLKQPTKHYVTHHNHVPAWILFKNVSFSKVINLFQLLNKKEKEMVVNLLFPTQLLAYDEKVVLTINSLNIIRCFRNKIAHNLKFVTYHCPNRLPTGIITKVLPTSLITAKEMKSRKIGINDIYSHILSIILLLDDVRLRQLFVNSLSIRLYTVNELWDQGRSLPIFQKYLQITKLPTDIIQRLDAFSQSLR